MIGRRSVLAGGLAGLLAPRMLAAAPGAPRVAALGWASAQTLLALGLEPVAVPEIERYQRLVAEPRLPPTVREAGLRSEPNLELLKDLAPDLIIADESLGAVRGRLETIAPVRTFVVTAHGGHPYERARASTLELGEAIGNRPGAETYLAASEAVIETARTKLAGYRGGPLFLASETRGTWMLTFGRNSIYQDMLDRFGIANAWTGETSVWGHATVGVEKLAAVPDARLVFLGSQIADFRALVAARPLFRTLPFVREGRITTLSEILFYGGVPSAVRFSRLLAERLPVVS